MALAWEQAEATARFQGLPLGNNHLFRRWAARLRTFKQTAGETRRGGGVAGEGGRGGGGAELTRLNAEATFPGDDPDARQQARESRRGEGEGVGVGTGAAADTMTEQERQEMEEQGWDIEKLVSYNEATAMQCPMS